MKESTSTDQGSRGVGLSIGQIVLEHAHFGHREDYWSHAPNALSKVELPTEVQVRIFESQVSVDDAADNRPIAGVSVRVRTETTVPPPLYSFDVAMTALVIADARSPDLPPIEFVGQAGLATLFPFLREMVANLTMRGRFGPIWLRPINIQSAVAEAVRAIQVREKPRENHPAAKAIQKPKGRKKRSN